MEQQICDLFKPVKPLVPGCHQHITAYFTFNVMRLDVLKYSARNYRSQSSMDRDNISSEHFSGKHSVHTFVQYDG